MRRLGPLLSLVLLLWLPAGAAWADPAGPTNYRSVLTSVPDVEGVELEVYGGDSFLVVDVDPGHEVLVYGYEHSDTVADLYLRVSPDGTVEVNRRSPSAWVNQDRYQGVEVPDFVDPTAPPDWEVVATGGSYAWHDHRIHWMSPQLPDAIDPDRGEQVVPFLENWQVPLAIDGVEHTLTGTLTWQPSPTPVPWAALLVLVAVGVVVLSRAVAGSALPVAGVGALLALAVGVGGAVGLPSGVGVVLPSILLPGVSLLGLAVLVRRPADTRAGLVAVASLPLVAWAVTQAGAITKPVVPSSVPVVAIRVAVAVAAGAALGAVLAALARTFGGDLSDLAALADAAEEGADAG